MFLYSFSVKSVVVYEYDYNWNINPPIEFDKQWPSIVRWQQCQGTAISPYHFITAAHVGGKIGDPLFNYETRNTHITINQYVHPSADISIWEVSTPFSSWVDVYNGTEEFGCRAYMFGRGMQKGTPVYGNDGLIDGWNWGEYDGKLRWGINTIEQISEQYLWTYFDPIPGEAMLMGGDSGGPLFIEKNNQWLLAGVNVAIDGGYSLDPYDENPSLYTILFDPEGWYLDGEIATDPTRSWTERLSSYDEWIFSITGEGAIPEPLSINIISYFLIGIFSIYKGYKKLFVS